MTETKERIKIAVDPTKLSLRGEGLLEDLKERIIGQDRAIGEIVRAFQKVFVQLNPPNRPLASLLFLGPTGVGKPPEEDSCQKTSSSQESN